MYVKNAYQIYIFSFFYNNKLKLKPYKSSIQLL